MPPWARASTTGARFGRRCRQCGRRSSLATATNRACVDTLNLQLGPANEQRLRDFQRIIDAVAATGDLHPSLEPSTAADILWTLGSPEVHQQLTIDRNWSNDDYCRWLTVTLQAVLLR
jgi:hypothetical protein